MTAFNGSEPTNRPPNEAALSKPARNRPGGIFAHLRAAVPVVACFAVALVFTFARAVSERIYSDEHLFLGGAGLMARGEGLIYRDFFYNHMPTHALVLTFLFKITSHWTLAARVFDALCGAAIVAVLFESGRRTFTATSPAWRIVLAGCMGAIFLFNPVTADAVGKAWNHDLAALSCLLGFVILAYGLRRPRPALWVITSGMLAAIAVTSRLTFAPPLVAFAVLILIAPGLPFAARVKHLGLFALGGLIGAAPALLVIAQAPANAYFENVKFPGLTTRYQGELQRGARDTLLRKLDFIQRVGAKSWSLHVFLWLTIVVTVAAGVALSASRNLRARTRPRLAMLIAAAILTLAACFAAFVPTPMYHQYLYGPVPFMVLLSILGISALGIERAWWARLAIVALAIVCIVSARDSYAGVSRIFAPSKWTPNRERRDGKRLARLAAPGRVLTFLPGIPLEAGLPIYPGLSIGRYATRIADYLTPDQRTRMNVPDLAEMRRWFAEDHPGAILLVDPESALERAVAGLAREHKYVAQPFGNDGWILYLPPR